MESDLAELRAVIADGRELNEEEEKQYAEILELYREEGGHYPWLHVDPL